MEFHQPAAEQQLLFFLDEEWESEHEQLMAALIDRIASGRQWTIRPPQLVDETDFDSMTQPDDEPILTFGGVLPLYASYLQDGQPIDRAVDMRQLLDCEFLVRELCEFSRQTHAEISFELDGTWVGTIQEGRPDEGISRCFLAEWRKHLENRAE